MYNLIVTGAAGTWDQAQYSMERSRVGEYTDDALSARYRVLDERTIAELMSFPTLFAYEKPLNAPARVGRVTHIATRGAGVRFKYVMLEGLPAIPAAQLLEQAQHLDIDDRAWEMNRTHWAVKDVDLMQVLGKFGLSPRDLAAPSQLGPVSQPSLSVTSVVVERALGDAERLIETQGPTSGVDRIHTALHGYLIEICQRAGLPLPTDPSITRLWNLLRQKDPRFQPTGARATDIERVLKAVAVIVDALNPVRNKASVAHPNPDLLSEPEAMLVINCVRTLLHYLDSRAIRSGGST